MVDQAVEPTGSLGTKLKRGAAISAGSLVFTQLVSLGQTLVVARLLTPAEIGVFAAGTVLTNFLVHFSEGGLRSALIQRERDVEDAAETVFRVTLCAGVAMSLLALVTSSIVGDVFHDQLVGAIAAATSGTLVLHALTGVPQALLQRRFDFRQRWIVDPSVALGYAVPAIVLSALGMGVWGLVVATYCSMLVWALLVWVLARWRPGRGRFSYRLARELQRFAFPLVVVEINERVREAAETVLVGRGLDATALGYYRYGSRIAMLPGVAIIQVCSYVLFPAFARIAGDPARLRAAFLRALRWIWFAAVPVAALMVAVGEPMIVVLLGERWRGSGPVIVFMAGYGLGVALDAVATESIKGVGRSRLLHWTTLARLLSTVGLLVLLLPYGLPGVALSVSVSAVFVGFLGLALARPLAGVRVGEIARLVVPPVVAGAAAAAVTRMFDTYVTRADTHSVGPALLFLACDGLLLVVVYALVHYIISPAPVTELAAGLVGRLRRRPPRHEVVR